MSAYAIVVAHRQRMVAEALASAVARRIGVTPTAAVTSIAEAERLSDRTSALALDALLADAAAAAMRMRRAGVRVVMLGEDLPTNGEAALSFEESVTALARALVPKWREAPPDGNTLSPREREILALIAHGLPAKQIARQLDSSVKTVENHKHRIFCKLSVPNQAAAVRTALVRGLV